MQQARLYRCSLSRLKTFATQKYIGRCSITISGVKLLKFKNQLDDVISA